jgi:hypothetical protein
MPKTPHTASDNDDSHPRGAQPGNDNAGSHHIYDVRFSDDELSRIIASLTDPAAGLDATVTATYVLLDRIMAQVSQNQEDAETFLRLVAAHNETTASPCLCAAKSVSHAGARLLMPNCSQQATNCTDLSRSPIFTNAICLVLPSK